MTWLDEIEEMAKKADAEVCAICLGERKWTMCVPVQDDDSDIVIIAPIRRIEYMARVLRELITIHPIIQEAVDFGEIGGDYIEAFGNWYDNLSDDARELIGDGR